MTWLVFSCTPVSESCVWLKICRAKDLGNFPYQSAHWHSIFYACGMAAHTLTLHVQHPLITDKHTQILDWISCKVPLAHHVQCRSVRHNICPTNTHKQMGRRKKTDRPMLYTRLSYKTASFDNQKEIIIQEQCSPFAVFSVRITWGNICTPPHILIGKQQKTFAPSLAQLLGQLEFPPSRRFLMHTTCTMESLMIFFSALYPARRWT